MHHLEGGAQDDTAEVRLLDPETASEAVHPAGEAATVGDNSTLILLVGDDFSKLNLDVFGVCGLSTKPAQGRGSLVESTTLDEVTWGVWQEEKATTQDETPGELDTDGDTVGATVSAILGGVGNARG